MGRPTGLLGLFFDTEGPEPLDRNDVVVDEVEGVLSAEQRSALQTQLHAIYCNTHEGLIIKFTIAKMFIHDVYNSLNV